MIDQTLSHYRIIEKIGQGGMGEVYRAEDTNLDREVAIKVLPERFSQDPERLARFEREAKLLASLNHPNIAAIYGFEHSGEIHFLVLELVEGDTLAERVAKGPLPVEEALEVCRQIAEGVEAAHDKGVIHRDLKPANVKVTPEGKIKILDFGLAKAFEGEVAAADISQSPTLTEEMTRAGVILGTAAYMSPEQAKGQPVDKRTDIFAFGCVLYELLTAKRAFAGDTITETIASVLKSEPDLEALPEKTAWRVLELLRQCFEKDARERLQHLGDGRIQINRALTEPTTSPIDGMSAAQPAGWKILAPWALAVVAGIITGVLAWSVMRSDPLSPPQVTRLTFRASPDQELNSFDPAPLAFSPDGRRLVYAARVEGVTQLYRRDLDQLEAEPIPGTEGAESPFFSPDGQWVGFFVDRMLQKVALAGGAPLKITDVPSGNSEPVGAKMARSSTLSVGPVC